MHLTKNFRRCNFDESAGDSNCTQKETIVGYTKNLAAILGIASVCSVAIADPLGSPSPALLSNPTEGIVVEFKDLDGDGEVAPLEISIQVWAEVRSIVESHANQTDPDDPTITTLFVKYVHALFGDLDGNGVVDAADLIHLLNSAGATESTVLDGDMLKDELIDISDVSILIGLLGQQVVFTEEEAMDRLADLLSIYLEADEEDLAPFNQLQLSGRISIRCYAIPNIPGGAHCALYDAKNKRICGAGPEHAPLPSGCIRGYCRDYENSPEHIMESSCTQPLGCYRTTPIVCLDDAGADQLMSCVASYMALVNSGCTPYKLLTGPNSNSTIHKAISCCLEMSDCKSPWTGGGRPPRTPGGTAPGAWGQGLEDLPPCIAYH